MGGNYAKQSTHQIDNKQCESCKDNFSLTKYPARRS